MKWNFCVFETRSRHQKKSFSQSRKLAKRSSIKIYIKSELDKKAVIILLLREHTKMIFDISSFLNVLLSIIRYVNDEFYVIFSRYKKNICWSFAPIFIKYILYFLLYVVSLFTWLYCWWVSDSIQLNELLTWNYEFVENPFILRPHTQNNTEKLALFLSLDIYLKRVIKFSRFSVFIE